MNPHPTHLIPTGRALPVPVPGTARRVTAACVRRLSLSVMLLVGVAGIPGNALTDGVVTAQTAAPVTMRGSRETVRTASEVSPTLQHVFERLVRHAAANYRMALRSDNPGLVESALYHSVVLRLHAPAADLESLSAEIDHLVARGATQTIRHKALLVCTVFAAPSLVDAAAIAMRSEPNEVFSEISAQLSARLFVVERGAGR